MSDPSLMRPQLIDLNHLGRSRVIGAWRVGDVIVDPGPSSTLAALEPILESHPPRVLALTHIHLDHAGAAGTLARRFPDLEVWVHERGAPHLANPEKLLASATRLYGEQMQALWGEFLAVPAERLRVLSGGETVGDFRVAYTPGHAAHHVSYLHQPSGWAFTGDVAGVRVGEGPVLAPTPPPDIDLHAWRDSLERIADWSPSRLAVTHFGAFDRVTSHLAELREHLEQLEALARGSDEAAFAAAIRARVRRSPGAEAAAVYEQATSPAQSFQGLKRYVSGLERAARPNTLAR